MTTGRTATDERTSRLPMPAAGPTMLLLAAPTAIIVGATMNWVSGLGDAIGGPAIRLTPIRGTHYTPGHIGVGTAAVGFGWIVICLAAAVIFGSVQAIVLGRWPRQSAWFSTVAGGMATALCLTALVEIRTNTAAFDIAYSLHPGFWICLAGAVITMLVGLALTVRPQLRRSY